MAQARLASRLSPTAHAFERTGALKRGAGKGNDRSRPCREWGPGFGSIWRGRPAWGSTSNARVEDHQPGNQQAQVQVCENAVKISLGFIVIEEIALSALQ